MIKLIIKKKKKQHNLTKDKNNNDINNRYKIKKNINNLINNIDNNKVNLKNNIGKIKNDNEIKNIIIRELKLISIINTKVNNLLGQNDPKNTIEIMIQNNYFNSNGNQQPFMVFKGIKIKDLKTEIIQKK